MTTERNRDDELMARLRSVAASADPVPDDVVLAGRSAIAHRDLDLRLAELVEEELTVGVRGDEPPWFTFEVDDVVIELAVRARNDTHSVVGQVDGVVPRSVSIRQPTTEHRCDVDALGRFSSQIDSGPVRIEFELDDGGTIATSWIAAG